VSISRRDIFGIHRVATISSDRATSRNGGLPFEKMYKINLKLKTLFSVILQTLTLPSHTKNGNSWEFFHLYFVCLLLFCFAQIQDIYNPTTAEFTYNYLGMYVQRLRSSGLDRF
jgi:hypothetical protein